MKHVLSEVHKVQWSVLQGSSVTFSDVVYNNIHYYEFKILRVLSDLNAGPYMTNKAQIK